MNPEKIYVLSNNKARANNKQKLEVSLKYLSKFLPTELLHTTSALDASNLATELSLNPKHIIVACGGDGTTNTLANAILDKVPLGIIPSGTANVIASELGISTNYSIACKSLLSSALKRINLPLINKKRFIFATGIGFDAEVASSITPSLKKLLGIFAYRVATLKHLLTTTPPNLKLLTSTNEYNAEFAIITNMRRYGGNLFFVPQACYNDELLEVLLVKKISISSIIKLYNYAKKRAPFPQEYATIIKAKSFIIESDRPVLYHVDGEIVGSSAHFNIASDGIKLKVLAP